MTLPHAITPRLGCAENYTVEVWMWDRQYRASPGAPLTPRARLVTQLTGVIQLYWERVLDDFSEARVRFRPEKGDDCCAKLAPKWNAAGELIDAGVWPWSHELVIYRDGEPVWTGPIFSVDETVRPDETTEFIQINARDHLGWVDRRVVHSDMQFSELTDLVTIARWIIIDAFAPDNVGITSANLPVYPPSGRLGRRTTRRWESRSGDELREIARGGVDFTCIGRNIIVKGVRRDTSQPVPELRNADFQVGTEIRIVGSEAATVGYAVGKIPEDPENNRTPVRRVIAENADDPAGDGVDQFFGLVEALTTASESDSEDFLDWMAHELVDENMPPPRALSIPAGSMLSPDANVSVHELIPSRHFKVTMRGTCNQLSQYMRLSHVEASWEPGIPERIGVTFIPGNSVVLIPEAAAPEED